MAISWQMFVESSPEERFQLYFQEGVNWPKSKEGEALSIFVIQLVSGQVHIVADLPEWLKSNWQLVMGFFQKKFSKAQEQELCNKLELLFGVKEEGAMIEQVKLLKRLSGSALPVEVSAKEDKELNFDRIRDRLLKEGIPKEEWEELPVDMKAVMWLRDFPVTSCRRGGNFWRYRLEVQGRTTVMVDNKLTEWILENILGGQSSLRKQAISIRERMSRAYRLQKWHLLDSVRMVDRCHYSRIDWRYPSVACKGWAVLPEEDHWSRQWADSHLVKPALEPAQVQPALPAFQRLTDKQLSFKLNELMRELRKRSEEDEPKAAHRRHTDRAWPPASCDITIWSDPEMGCEIEELLFGGEQFARIKVFNLSSEQQKILTTSLLFKKEQLDQLAMVWGDHRAKQLEESVCKQEGPAS